MKAMKRVMVCQNGAPETQHCIRPKTLDSDSNPKFHINLYPLWDSSYAVGYEVYSLLERGVT